MLLLAQVINNTIMKNWLKSSQNPAQVSNTVRGSILAVAGIILLFSQYFGLPYTETDIVEFASQIGVSVGALWAIYGLVMKGVMKIGKE